MTVITQLLQFSRFLSRLDTKLPVSRQVLAPATPPAPTHHATVIVPAPAQPVLPHHVTVVTMGPASVINTASTSRQNLDTIVQVRQPARNDIMISTVFYFVMMLHFATSFKM